MIRLYGTKSMGSFEIVTTGLEIGLQSIGRFAGLERLDKDSEDPSPGGAAMQGLVVGNPFTVTIPHFRGAHGEVWLMLAPNSEGVPADIIKYLKDEIFSLRLEKKVPLITGLYAPSTWAVGVLERCFPDKKVKLLRHGVLPEFRVDPVARQVVLEDFDKGLFRVVHATSTFHERKGTRMLLQAWSAFQKDAPKASLLITCQPSAQPLYQDVAAKLGCKNVYYAPNHSMARPQWVEVLSRVHAVCQPSRGEGFGLVPLEARAAGVPVSATASTGHSEHMPPGTVDGVSVIPHGGMTPVDDYPGSMAPSVTVNAILTSLQELHQGYQKHHAAALFAAPTVQADWAWENVTRKDLV